MRTGSYLATVALSLVSAPLLIRHLGIVQFGRYTTVLAIVTMVVGLTDAGLLNMGLREWTSRRGAERARVMRTLLGIRLELSLVGLIIGVGFAAVAGYGWALVLGTLLAGFGMALQMTSDLLTVALQGELRFGWVAAIDFARQFVTVCLIVLFVVLGSPLLPFLAIPIAAGLAALMLAATLVRGHIPMVPQFNGPETWSLLRDIAPYSGAVALNTVYFRMTLVVMSVIASARQTGYFATSFRVTEVLISLPALAIGASFPILSRAAGEERSRFASAANRILDLGFMTGAALSLCVLLGAPFAVSVLAGPAGRPAVGVLQIQGLALTAAFVGVGSGFALLSLRRHVVVLLANGASLLVNLVLALVLVPADRAKGAAIAAVVAECCLTAAQLFALSHQSQVRLHLTGVRPTAVAALAGASPLLLDIPSILRTVLGMTIFIGALAVQRRLPSELGLVLAPLRRLRAHW